MGTPIDGAVAAIKHLNERHTIVIHTIWATDEQKRNVIKEWLLYFNIPFARITATKPDAAVYIDDKALHFDNWEHVLQLLQTLP